MATGGEGKNACNCLCEIAYHTHRSNSFLCIMAEGWPGAKLPNFILGDKPYRSFWVLTNSKGNSKKPHRCIRNFAGVRLMDATGWTPVALFKINEMFPRPVFPHSCISTILPVLLMHTTRWIFMVFCWEYNFAGCFLRDVTGWIPMVLLQTDQYFHARCASPQYLE